MSLFIWDKGIAPLEVQVGVELPMGLDGPAVPLMKLVPTPAGTGIRFELEVELT